jgi:hypothetical protein
MKEAHRVSAAVQSHTALRQTIGNAGVVIFNEGRREDDNGRCCGFL